MINPQARIITEIQRLRPEKSEVKRLLGSNEKIKKLTGWQPAWSLDGGLKETVKWFSDKKNLINYKHTIYNI